MTPRAEYVRGNCRGASILLTQPSVSFPSMTLPNMLEMWFFRDIYKKHHPCRILRAKYNKQLKGGNHKLSNMKYLVKQVIRAARIVDRNDLVVQNWYPRNIMDL